MADRNILKLCYMLGFICLILPMICPAAETTNQDWEFFYNKIFSTYNPLSFPRNNQSDQLRVTIEMTLDNIQEFSDTDGTITLVGSFEIGWTSEILTWALQPVGVSGNIPTAKIPRSEMWYPPVFVNNGVEKLTAVGTDNDLIDVSYTGRNVWKPPFIIKAGCDVDIKLFPFDSQTCSFDMSILDYTSEEVYLTSNVNRSYTTAYAENIVWSLLSTSVSNNEKGDTTIVSFSVNLKRRSTYFVIIFASPILILGIINGFAFLMPIDHGRVGFAMAVYLTFSVFLSIIGDNLPRTSNPLSTLSIYILMLMTFSGLITIISIVTVRQHLKTIDLPVPDVIAFIIGSLCCMVCRCKREKKATIYPDGISVSSLEIEEGPRKIDVYYMPPELKFGVSNVKFDGWRPAEEIEEPPPYSKRVTCAERCWFCRVPEEITWMFVSRVFDYFLFAATMAVHGYLGFIYLTPLLKEAGYI